MHPTEMYLKETHAQVGLGEWWGSERRGRGGAQYCARKRKPGEEVPAEKPLGIVSGSCSCLVVLASGLFHRGS